MKNEGRPPGDIIRRRTLLPVDGAFLHGVHSQWLVLVGLKILAAKLETCSTSSNTGLTRAYFIGLITMSINSIRTSKQKL